MSAAPVPGKTLYLSDSVSSSKKMSVFKMSPGAIQGLNKGKRVRVFASNNDGPQFIMQLTLRGLCAFMPAVAQALATHNSANGTTINDIVLPARDLRTYSRILRWTFACMKEGKVIQFGRIERGDALRIYKDIKAAATVLGVGYLVKDMNKRVTAMTKTMSA